MWVGLGWVDGDRSTMYGYLDSACESGLIGWCQVDRSGNDATVWLEDSC